MGLVSCQIYPQNPVNHTKLKRHRKKPDYVPLEKKHSRLKPNDKTINISLEVKLLICGASETKAKPIYHIL